MRAGFAAPGIEGRTPIGERPTDLRIASPGEASAWSAAARSLIAETPVGSSRFEVSRLDGLGLLMDHEVFGQFLVGFDGLDVECVPGQRVAWRWQRFLVGQVLPLVALVRGKEVFHASAVDIGGRAALFMGPSGAGKTSAALGLVGRGARFVADDVAALEIAGAQVLVHPGAGLASVESADPSSSRVALPTRGVSVLGEWDGEMRIELAEDVGAVPVAALCLLDPVVEGRGVEIDPVESSRAITLLGMTFNSYVVEPSRLERQLDVIGRLLDTAELVRVRAPRSLGHEALQDALSSYLGPALASPSPRPII